MIYTAVGATYGVALLIDFDQPIVFQRHIAHIIPNPEILSGEYVELFLNSPIGKTQSDKNAIGSAQPTVTLGSLSRFLVPFPPLAEQTILAERVREVRKSTCAFVERRQAVGALRRNLLNGDLR